MIGMDLNSINWVGNVYQKFETMCLEVEEVVCQDTVKYVENQVQSVGASVKKFYSDVMQDVMQDLLLPSSLESMKSAASSDLPVEKYAGTLKNPNLVFKEDAIKVDAAQLMEDSEATADVNKNAAHVSLSCQLPVENDIFESFSAYDNHCTLTSSSIENLHVPETSAEASSVDDEFCRISALSENDNAINGMSCHLIPPTLVTDLVEEDDCDSIEGSCNEIESAHDSMDETLTDSLHLVESIEKGEVEMEMRCSCSVIGSLESNGRSKNWTLETSGSKAISAKETETIQQLDKTRLEESCIMVNGAEFHFHPQREGKHKPYQKKIRDAISARMRSARKNEYKKLALWRQNEVKSDQDCEGSSSTALTREDTRRSLANDVLDSEWELL